MEREPNIDELRTIFNSIPAMIFFKDNKNVMLRVNDTFANAVGKSKSEIEGKSCSVLFPEQAKSYWDDDMRVIETGKAIRGIVEKMQTAKGLIWVQTDKIPYLDSKGEIRGVIGFAIDITEKKNAEDALKKRAEELEKFEQIAINRELKMVEMKKELEKLKKK